MGPAGQERITWGTIGDSLLAAGRVGGSDERGMMHCPTGASAANDERVAGGTADSYTKGSGSLGFQGSSDGYG
jgi:hypothetical protein